MITFTCTHFSFLSFLPSLFPPVPSFFLTLSSSCMNSTIIAAKTEKIFFNFFSPPIYVSFFNFFEWDEKMVKKTFANYMVSLFPFKFFFFAFFSFVNNKNSTIIISITIVNSNNKKLYAIKGFHSKKGEKKMHTYKYRKLYVLLSKILWKVYSVFFFFINNLPF